MDGTDEMTLLFVQCFAVLFDMFGVLFCSVSPPNPQSTTQDSAFVCAWGSNRSHLCVVQLSIFERIVCPNASMYTRKIHSHLGNLQIRPENQRWSLMESVERAGMPSGLTLN